MTICKSTSLIIALLGGLFFPTFIYAAPLSDEAVKQAIIKASIANYAGKCPCPYHRTRNGSSCGKRSAYSKPGGYSPKCYAEDISPQEVRLWRQRNPSR